MAYSLFNFEIIVQEIKSSLWTVTLVSIFKILTLHVIKSLAPQEDKKGLEVLWRHNNVFLKLNTCHMSIEIRGGVPWLLNSGKSKQ